ncbi:hypothetical protein GWI33_022556 [Rhynchophorus ferrugineus]|uniref:Voltage-dependent anion-selective channel n=1 Tax=Rhynchophorus ferrugineus TaxID=354439 RepID=A0A834IUD6_RHYFE|nr:hypothetical protein GWI33_022556 [Rhynchophorus ferrugineus]
MAPPPYSDLGKKAKDVFNKGYHFGLIKLDCKTKSSSGVEFSTGGTSNQESGKWNTDNTLSTDLSVQDQGLQGLKLSACLDFAPHTGGQYRVKDFNLNLGHNISDEWGKIETKAVWKIAQKTGNVKTAFVNNQVAINADADFTPDGPKVTGSAVVGYQGWLAGFTSGDFTLHSNVDDGQEFGGSIYQKINPKLETGITLNWSSGSSNTKFGIGAKYDLDKDASVRFKVNNASQIGLGYQQRLRDGVTLTLSSLIDGKNFNQGGHKIGLALELEA